MTDLTHPVPHASWETRGWWEGCGRGELVLQALRCRSAAEIRSLIASLDGRTYNPFNLLFGDGRELAVAYAREAAEIAEALFAYLQK